MLLLSGAYADAAGCQANTPKSDVPTASGRPNWLRAAMTVRFMAPASVCWTQATPLARNWLFWGLASILAVDLAKLSVYVRTVHSPVVVEMVHCFAAFVPTCLPLVYVMGLPFAAERKQSRSTREKQRPGSRQSAFMLSYCVPSEDPFVCISVARLDWLSSIAGPLPGVHGWWTAAFLVLVVTRMSVLGMERCRQQRVAELQQCQRVVQRDETVGVFLLHGSMLISPAGVPVPMGSRDPKSSLGEGATCLHHTVPEAGTMAFTELEA